VGPNHEEDVQQVERNLLWAKQLSLPVLSRLRLLWVREKRERERERERTFSETGPLTSFLPLTPVFESLEIHGKKGQSGCT